MQLQGEHKVKAINQFFLVGAERSGSTLFRLILDNHPNIACHGEFEFAFDHVADDGTEPDVVSYKKLMESDRVFKHFQHTVNTSISYAQNIDFYLNNKKGAKEIIGATVHRNIHRIVHLYPNAKFIHLVRDPRDVARSVKNMGWSSNPYTSTLRWWKVELEWEQLKHELDESRWIEVKFESLIENTQLELEKVCSFLGEAYAEEMLDYSKSSSYSSPKKGRSEAWRKDMSKRDVQLVELVAGDLMQQRGYRLSGYTQIGALSKAQLHLIKLRDWRYRLSHRISKYGLALVITEYFYRKLGITSAQKAALFKMHEIDNKLLK